MEILGFVVTADVSGLTQMNADKIHLRSSAVQNNQFAEFR